VNSNRPLCEHRANELGGSETRFSSPGDGGILARMDQDLLELAIRARGGELELALAMHHDVPAIDWWRRTGVPEDMRALVGALAGVAADSAA
jgi:hypothetical protein